MSEVEYVAVSLPFHVAGEDARLVYWTAWLCKICAHRLLEHVKQNTLLADLSQYEFIKVARKLCYDVLPNRRYIDGIATLIHSSLRSVKALKVDMTKLELKPWLLFQSEAEP